MESIASILVVDDEPDLLNHIGLALEAEGYRVLKANDGLEALDCLQVEPVDLIVADIAMPRMNGYQLYERLREQRGWTLIPFVFLTARTLDSDIQYGKGLGVDDYLTKPIRAAELLATVQGKLRRAQQLTNASEEQDKLPPKETDSLIVGQLRIEPSQHRVWLNGEEIKLSAREFTLLEYLVRQDGKVVTPSDLIRITHQLQTHPFEAGQLLRPLIFSLHSKLASASDGINYVENVRGVGYRLIVPSP
ncbi:MAG TPA: response regulator transcription factor [Anaerolineae bacterium]|jgi:DNA-binding response OmpR family regulator